MCVCVSYRVLIFSQFKIMLDVLEDWLKACDWKFERIDGDTPQQDRQKKIDAFQNGEQTQVHLVHEPTML